MILTKIKSLTSGASTQWPTFLLLLGWAISWNEWTSSRRSLVRQTSVRVVSGLVDCSTPRLTWPPLDSQLPRKTIGLLKSSPWSSLSTQHPSNSKTTHQDSSSLASLCREPSTLLKIRASNSLRLWDVNCRWLTSSGFTSARSIKTVRHRLSRSLSISTSRGPIWSLPSRFPLRAFSRMSGTSAEWPSSHGAQSERKSNRLILL